MCSSDSGYEKRASDSCKQDKYRQLQVSPPSQSRCFVRSCLPGFPFLRALTGTGALAFAHPAGNVAFFEGGGDKTNLFYGGVIGGTYTGS